MNAVVKQQDQTELTGFVSMVERAAANPNIDVEKLERLLAMQERVLTRQAEIAFNEAMRAVQQELPKIRRNKRNQQTSSNYADLEALSDAIVPVYTRNGFSLSFGTSDCPKAEYSRITCLVSHSGGHSRSYQADVPDDLTGLKGNANKTKTHAFGSTMSYGRRYLTLLIFNITLTNEDDDGNGSGSGSITEEQEATLLSLIDDVGANKGAFLKYLKVESLSDIPARAYKTAVEALEAKRRAS